MPPRIDSIDQQIVQLLQEDGRMAYAEIARRLGDVTERMVRGRIQRLISKDVIQVSAVVNSQTIGYTVIADVWVAADPAALPDIAKALHELENVTYLAYSTGEYNLSLQVRACTIGEFHDLVTNVIGRMPGVKGTTSTVIPNILKDVHQWGFPSAIVGD